MMRTNLITVGTTIIATICKEKQDRVHKRKFLAYFTANVVKIGYILHPMFLNYGI